MTSGLVIENKHHVISVLCNRSKDNKSSLC